MVSAGRVGLDTGYETRCTSSYPSEEDYSAVQPWEYRIETASTGYDATRPATPSPQSTATSATSTRRPTSCSGRRTWWWTPGRGSSAARCCCRPVWSSGSTPSAQGLRRPDQAPDQGRARVRRLVLSRRRRSCGFNSGPRISRWLPGLDFSLRKRGITHIHRRCTTGCGEYKRHVRVHARLTRRTNGFPAMAIPNRISVHQ